MIRFIINTIFFGIVAVVLLVGANELGRRLPTGSIGLDDEMRFTWNALGKLPALFGGEQPADWFNRTKAESLSSGQIIGLTQTNGAGIGPHKEVEVVKPADHTDSHAPIIVSNNDGEFSRMAAVIAATRGELSAGHR